MSNNPQTDRRERYATAMDAVTGGICPTDLIDAVIAVADAELAARRAADLRDAEEICDEAGAGYASKDLTGHADAAYSLMARFQRKAEEAEQTAVLPAVPVAAPPTDQAADLVPPAAEGLPLAALDSATEGADRLDAWALSPQGRNFLAHALVQLARDGWLRAEAGEGFEPMPEREPALPAVPVPPTTHATNRAAVLREAADRIAAGPQECKPGRCPGESPELLRRMADEAQQQPDNETRPARGDQFEAWLKTQRDAYGWKGTNDRTLYDAIDGLLGLYRLHADAGTPLLEHTCTGRAVGDCECLEAGRA